MELSRFINDLATIEARIKRDIHQVTAKAANDLASGVAYRVVHRSENARGQKFSSYSTNKYYASSFKKKGRNASSDARLSALGRGAKITYADFRQVNNLNASEKNFEFTGDMWRTYGVVSVEEQNNAVTATIGCKNDANAKKMAYLSKQEGIDIGAASAQEELDVRADFENWLKQIFT